MTSRLGTHHRLVLYRSDPLRTLHRPENQIRQSRCPARFRPRMTDDALHFGGGAGTGPGPLGRRRRLGTHLPQSRMLGGSPGRSKGSDPVSEWSVLKRLGDG